MSIPKSLFEALNNEEWKQAMGMEMEALKKNDTWDIVLLPKGKKFNWMKMVVHKEI